MMEWDGNRMLKVQLRVSGCVNGEVEIEDAPSQLSDEANEEAGPAY